MMCKAFLQEVIENRIIKEINKRENIELLTLKEFVTLVKVPHDKSIIQLICILN